MSFNKIISLISQFEDYTSIYSLMGQNKQETTYFNVIRVNEHTLVYLEELNQFYNQIKDSIDYPCFLTIKDAYFWCNDKNQKIYYVISSEDYSRYQYLYYNQNQIDFINKCGEQITKRFKDIIPFVTNWSADCFIKTSCFQAISFFLFNILDLCWVTKDFKIKTDNQQLKFTSCQDLQIRGYYYLNSIQKLFSIKYPDFLCKNKELINQISQYEFKLFDITKLTEDKMYLQLQNERKREKKYIYKYLRCNENEQLRNLLEKLQNKQIQSFLNIQSIQQLKLDEQRNFIEIQEKFWENKIKFPLSINCNKRQYFNILAQIVNNIIEIYQLGLDQFVDLKQIFHNKIGDRVIFSLSFSFLEREISKQEKIEPIINELCLLLSENTYINNKLFIQETIKNQIEQLKIILKTQSEEFKIDKLKNHCLQDLQVYLNKLRMFYQSSDRYSEDAPQKKPKLKNNWELYIDYSFAYFEDIQFQFVNGLRIDFQLLIKQKVQQVLNQLKSSLNLRCLKLVNIDNSHISDLTVINMLYSLKCLTLKYHHYYNYENNIILSDISYLDQLECLYIEDNCLLDFTRNYSTNYFNQYLDFKMCLSKAKNLLKQKIVLPKDILSKPVNDFNKNQINVYFKEIKPKDQYLELFSTTGARQNEIGSQKTQKAINNHNECKNVLESQKQQTTNQSLKTEENTKLFSIPRNNLFSDPQKNLFSTPLNNLFSVPQKNLFSAPQKNLFSAPSNNLFSTPSNNLFGNVNLTQNQQNQINDLSNKQQQNLIEIENKQNVQFFFSFFQNEEKRNQFLDQINNYVNTNQFLLTYLMQSPTNSILLECAETKAGNKKSFILKISSTNNKCEVTHIDLKINGKINCSLNINEKMEDQESFCSDWNIIESQISKAQYLIGEDYIPSCKHCEYNQLQQQLYKNQQFLQSLKIGINLCYRNINTFSFGFNKLQKIRLTNISLVVYQADNYDTNMIKKLVHELSQIHNLHSLKIIFPQNNKRRSLFLKLRNLKRLISLKLI